MHKPLFAALAVAVLLAPAVGRATDITPAAQKAVDAIDALDVEQHWPAGVHVNWETGEPDGRPESGAGKHTHCSAFVAAAARRLGVYILRPPEHTQILLANAQYDWLETDGARKGWRPVATAVEAQAAANRGALVVAVYRNRHDEKPGHIAIVRPSEKSVEAIRSEGPQVTQAGATNYRSTTLKQGFSGHPGAWDRGEVLFYAHPVDPATVR